MTELPVHPLVLRRADLAARRSAADILAAARAEAEAIRVGLAGEREAARREGFAAGLAEASAVARGAADAAAQFWRQHEAQLTEVALAVAHRMLSELPPDDVLAALAREAVAAHGRACRLVLQVAADAVTPLRERLRADGHSDHVDVVGSPDAEAGTCILIHPRGRTELGLLAQFREALAAVSRPEARA